MIWHDLSTHSWPQFATYDETFLNEDNMFLLLWSDQVPRECNRIIHYRITSQLNHFGSEDLDLEILMEG